MDMDEAYLGPTSNSECRAFQCCKGVILRKHCHTSKSFDIKVVYIVDCLDLVVNGQVTSSIDCYIFHGFKMS